jgi:alanyl-tRNA synthetase
MREEADRARAQHKSVITFVSSASNRSAKLLVTVTKDLTDRFNAGDIIKEIAPIIGGSGGGRPDMAQAGGNEPGKIKEAEKALVSIIEKTGRK